MGAEIYRTVPGDTFDGIAWRIWNREHMARYLIESNPDQADVLIFRPGIELIVPDIKPDTTVTDLPPWYDGGKA